jgi:hypothetical protein
MELYVCILENLILKSIVKLLVPNAQSELSSAVIASPAVVNFIEELPKAAVVVECSTPPIAVRACGAEPPWALSRKVTL